MTRTWRCRLHLHYWRLDRLSISRSTGYLMYHDRCVRCGRTRTGVRV